MEAEIALELLGFFGFVEVFRFANVLRFDPADREVCGVSSAADSEVRRPDLDVLGVVEGVNGGVEGFEKVLKCVAMSLFSGDA